MIAVIKFPGTTCELETAMALKEAGLRGEIVDHADFDPDRFESVVLPGGFSFGDYLRAGAIAAGSESLKKIKEMADSGKKVLGICNGFQILTEAGLLRGALLPNLNGRFLTKWVYLKVVRDDTAITRNLGGRVLFMPIAHAEGRYYGEGDWVQRTIVMTYSSATGEVNEKWNPNGSLWNTAAVANESGNVVGMMPHPERASFPFSRSTDGLQLLRGLGGR